MEQWTKDTQTLDDWTQQFRAVAYALQRDGMATEEGIKKITKELEWAKTYKTPSKAMLDEMLEKSPFNDYKPYMDLNPNNWSNDGDLDSIKPAMQHFDRSLRAFGEDLQKMRDSQISVENVIKDMSTTFEVRIRELEDRLGKQPSDLNAKYDAPTVWGSVACVAEVVDDLPTFVDERIGPLSRECDRLMREIKLDVQRDIEEHTDPFFRRLNELTHGLNIMGRNLKGGINSNHASIDRLYDTVTNQLSNTNDEQ